MEGEIIDLLSQVTSAARGRLQHLPVLAELGLPSYQARLLLLSARFPGWSQQRLARATERDKAQVARALKELEARGLLTRTADAKDARTNGVAVTDAGRVVAERLARERHTLGLALLGTLSQDERATLADLLRRLAGDLTVDER